MLQPPADLFVKRKGESSISPFTLQGGPFNTTRQANNLSEHVFNKTRSQLNNRDIRDSDYILKDVLTEHIRFGSPDTTLRFDGEKFTLDFLAIHKSIWSSLPEQLQVSLLFTNANGAFFHMAIPLELGGTQKEENRFLKTWFSDGSPGDSTVNDLLRVSEDPVKIAILQTCLQINIGQANRQVLPYTLCLFRKGISIPKASAPKWLLRPEKTRRFTFGSILQFLKADLFKSYITHINSQGITVTVATREISKKELFSSNTQKTFQPAYYSVKQSDLVGRQVQSKTEGFINPDQIKGLQNVKCYPIDLVSQVDDQGNIFVDQSTNKPLTLDDVKEAGGRPVDPEGAIDEESAERMNRIRFWFFVVVISFIAIVALIVIIIYVLRATTAAAPSAIAAPVAGPSP
jgi:hypothetical protein